jgi:hypothetical protein
VAGGRHIRGTFRRVGLIGLAIMTFGLADQSAAAKPQDTLTVSVTTVPSGFTPEQIAAGLPTTGKGLAGRLNSATPACERNRQLFARYKYWFLDEPIEIGLANRNGKPLKTTGNGAWSTPPLSFLAFHSPMDVRFNVFVKKRGACLKVTSRTMIVPVQVFPGEA